MKLKKLLEVSKRIKEMTPKTLFNIILKVIGIIMIKELLIMFSQFISVLFYFPSSWEEIAFSLLPLLGITIYVGIVYLLIFRTDSIISLFKLENNFDEGRIDFNIGLSIIIKVSIVVVGSLTIIDSIPIFINGIISYIVQSELVQGGMGYNSSLETVLISLTKMILSYLLIKNQSSIANWIVEKTSN